MGQVDLSNYKSLYLQTAKEYINTLLAACNTLTTDLQNKEAISNIHISSHSLKSQSQTMGYKSIADLSAIIEKIASDALAGTVELNNEAVLDIKKSAEELQSFLDAI